MYLISKTAKRKWRRDDAKECPSFNRFETLHNENRVLSNPDASPMCVRSTKGGYWHGPPQDITVYLFIIVVMQLFWHQHFTLGWHILAVPNLHCRRDETKLCVTLCNLISPDLAFALVWSLGCKKYTELHHVFNTSETGTAALLKRHTCRSSLEDAQLILYRLHLHNMRSTLYAMATLEEVAVKKKKTCHYRATGKCKWQYAF